MQNTHRRLNVSKVSCLFRRALAPASSHLDRKNLWIATLQLDLFTPDMTFRINIYWSRNLSKKNKAILLNFFYVYILLFISILISVFKIIFYMIASCPVLFPVHTFKLKVCACVGQLHKSRGQKKEVTSPFQSSLHPASLPDLHLGDVNFL